MRTVLLLTSLTNVCSSYKYIQLECHVNDGSEVVAQRVLDELSDAVMTRNRTAIADCLSDTFGFSGKVRGLKKDYVLRISKLITFNGTVTSAWGTSPPIIFTYADFNFIGKHRIVHFHPKKGEEGKYIILSITNEFDFQEYYKLEKKEQVAVDFLLSLIKSINFKDRDAVLTHMTDDFQLSAWNL
ncbi:hypothetical protein L5515_003569 [Caenorhabditis briggsae]|uniref:Uncharacterized protein n=1 Tax=Caenorhabditis briggsae TaxID=6238 RepID=A0AAE9J9V6_CAEBR|nr:hypothetical protein L5515_003569 [Caenorhabditis briggsae]